MPDYQANNLLLDRLCAVLDAFSHEQKVLTMMNISQAAGLPKSTTHRLVNSLVNYGLLARDPDRPGYRLGSHLIRWGTLALESASLRTMALPVLHEVAEVIGETSVLSIRDGNTGMWIEQIECEKAVRWMRRVGQRLMLHAGASSKVLLAFLDPIEFERILTSINLVPITPTTITNRDVLRRDMEKIRQRGYAVSYEETDEGAMGIAAPVYDHNRSPVAGLGVIAPLHRIPPDKVEETADYLIEASRSLSEDLGAPVDEMLWKDQAAMAPTGYAGAFLGDQAGCHVRDK